MISDPARTTDTPVALPDAPCLTVSALRAHILDSEGECLEMSLKLAGGYMKGKAAIVCHAPFTRARIGAENFLSYDALELFAFVHPAQFCTPTTRGLAKTLGLSVPAQAEDMPLALYECAQALLADLPKLPNRDRLLSIAEVMGLNGKGWPWTPFVFQALGEVYDPERPLDARKALNVWDKLPEWAEEAPPAPPAHHPVTGEEARERLKSLLGDASEERPQQKDYASAMTAMFRPVDISYPSHSTPPSNSPPEEGGEYECNSSPLAKGGGQEGGHETKGGYDKGQASPHTVLAEAGTGTGKTLGYLAPASVWAEKNEGSVWISTYTKNLQRQIESELDRLYPERDIKNVRSAIRKGRENYLCLLNFEESAAASGLARYPYQAVAAGLMTRWVQASPDGDLTGGSFPGWLPGLLGRAQTVGLSDRRGECIYGACDHYHRCFVERSIRKSQRAQIVVANHALVMISAATSGPESNLPKRIVFDEGHHLFDAADSAFAAHLTAKETQELRRWLMGAEGARRSRARGLRKRIEGLIEDDPQAEAMLGRIEIAAQGLTGQGWSKRIKSGLPSGPAEKFLYAVYLQVHARADGQDTPYSLETDTFPLTDSVAESAVLLKKALRDVEQPIKLLVKKLRAQLEDDTGDLEEDTRKRIDYVCTALGLRQLTLQAWIRMLETLSVVPAQAGESWEGENSQESFIDWMEIERVDGQAIDVGLYRHYVDPMAPFAASLRPHVHGVTVTSATLRDNTGDEEQDWNAARERTGADYLTHAPVLFETPSPFDYAKNAKVIVITDVNRNDLAQVASAYRALFLAAQGGALGLFTAIQRLRAVHEKIQGPLEAAGIPLYAQHADDINAGTLVDMFREDTHACLLGTDAVRDGVDVPGESLRLLVYDRVPWPRPTILHKARRKRFGDRQYDEMITRLRLKQAFGRLIRGANDSGVFVMMDAGLPSRLLGAFPEGVAVERSGLSDAIKSVESFSAKK